MAVISLTSCLKAKSDFAGIREDKGSIVTSIKETQYLNVDAQNIGFHFNVFSNFSFNQLPNEQVKFFTLHVAQPRDNKVSGSMVVKVAMTPHPGWLDANGNVIQAFVFPPAGAITIPSEITIPAQGGTSFEIPIKFAVNKALLNAANWYGAKFTVTTVSQGVVSSLDKSIDVAFNVDPAWVIGASSATFNTSRITGLYQATTTIVDANKVYGITNNTRKFYLLETGNNVVDGVDLYQYAFGSANYDQLYGANLTLGTQTPIIPVRYVLDASGKVIDVRNSRTGLSLTPTFDASAPNSFVYTSNDERVLSVKYSVTLTLNAIPRVFTITDIYRYDNIQAFY